MSERRTKVYLNLSFPELSAKYAGLPADGIGIMRAEFFALSLGVHPRKLIHEGGAEAFVDCFSTGLMSIAKDFHPRPVTYRTLDLKSNEYRGLLGGEEFEPKEENPMIGFRGASRYLADPESFRLELRAVKRARDHGLKNIRLMLPFVRFVSELERCREIIGEEGLFDDGMELWMMAEVPSNVFLIEKFAAQVDGVSIGSNDLAQLVLGIDRDSHRMAPFYDQRDEAVMVAIEHLIRACRAHGREVSICGEAPSRYPDMATKLFEFGISSFSVPPESVEKIRDLVMTLESGRSK